MITIPVNPNNLFSVYHNNKTNEVLTVEIDEAPINPREDSDGYITDIYSFVRNSIFYKMSESDFDEWVDSCDDIFKIIELKFIYGKCVILKSKLLEVGINNLTDDEIINSANLELKELSEYINGECYIVSLWKDGELIDDSISVIGYDNIFNYFNINKDDFIEVNDFKKKIKSFIEI